MSDEVYILFHFKSILNTTGCRLLKELCPLVLKTHHVNTDDASFLEEKIFLKIYEHLSGTKRKIEVMVQKCISYKGHSTGNCYSNVKLEIPTLLTAHLHHTERTSMKCCPQTNGIQT